MLLSLKKNFQCVSITSIIKILSHLASGHISIAMTFLQVYQPTLSLSTLLPLTRLSFIRNTPHPCLFLKVLHSVISSLRIFPFYFPLMIITPPLLALYKLITILLLENTLFFPISYLCLTGKVWISFIFDILRVWECNMSLMKFC